MRGFDSARSLETCFHGLHSFSGQFQVSFRAVSGHGLEFLGQFRIVLGQFRIVSGRGALVGTRRLRKKIEFRLFRVGFGLFRVASG